MPTGKRHQAISRIRTGSNYADLHSWMDRDPKHRGIYHREARHSLTEEDEQRIRQFRGGGKEGDKAVIEWLFHIALDYLDTARKLAKRTYGENGYNFFRIGFSNNDFIFYDNAHLEDSELEEEFDNVYETDDD